MAEIVIFPQWRRIGLVREVASRARGSLHGRRIVDAELRRLAESLARVGFTSDEIEVEMDDLRAAIVEQTVETVRSDISRA